MLNLNSWVFLLDESKRKVHCLEIEGDLVFSLSGTSFTILKKLLGNEALEPRELEYVSSFPFLDDKLGKQKFSIETLIEAHPDFERVEVNHSIPIYAEDLKFLNPYPYRMT